MTTRSNHREALEHLPHDQWDAYLTEHSGLPGPRGNLELLDVVGDLAPAADLRRWAASDDEYLASCGAAGLGRLLADGDASTEAQLKALAADARWRVREGVAMALQRLGDADLGRLHELVKGWATAQPLVQRAAVAGLCEPRLLRGDARPALDLLDDVTTRLVALDPGRRRDDDVRTLRKALGYCWSVAVAADPTLGFPRMLRWAASADEDVRWVVRENLKKARLARADPERTAELAALMGS